MKRFEVEISYNVPNKTTLRFWARNKEDAAEIAKLDFQSKIKGDITGINIAKESDK